jgi:hypothetical protein
MPTLDALIGHVRRWLRPWTAGVEPIEVHRAVLDEIESHVVPAGGGRKLFPYRRVRVELLAERPEERPVLEALALDAWDLPAEVRERLRAADVQFSDDLEVEVAVTESGGPEFGERRFRVAFERGATAHPPPAVPPPSRPALVLTVTQGEATQQVYLPSGERVQIGRLAEVLDTDGRVRRRNDVVFLEEGEINQTVSREHARIAWDAAEGSYWLRDEGSSYGTKVFREGRQIEVSGHDRRGVRLAHGDELYFGRARVKVALRGE